VAPLTRLGRRLLVEPSDRGLARKGCGWATSRPDQFATTTPVMTAVATTRPSPSAVTSEVSSRDQPRGLSFVSWRLRERRDVIVVITLVVAERDA
jgi:hypothetical protein